MTELELFLKSLHSHTIHQNRFEYNVVTLAKYCQNLISTSLGTILKMHRAESCDLTNFLTILNLVNCNFSMLCFHEFLKFESNKSEIGRNRNRFTWKFKKFCQIAINSEKNLIAFYLGHNFVFKSSLVCCA